MTRILSLATLAVAFSYACGEDAVSPGAGARGQVILPQGSRSRRPISPS